MALRYIFDTIGLITNLIQSPDTVLKDSISEAVRQVPMSYNN